MNDQNILKRHIQPAARKMGLPFVNWRCLRTSHATWLVQAGADPKSVQGQMRHPASQPQWIFTLRLFLPRNAEHSNSWQNLPKMQRRMHGPLRSNKTGFSMIGHGRKSRQVVEKIGRAGRDRTDDLIVANDEGLHRK